MRAIKFQEYVHDRVQFKRNTVWFDQTSRQLKSIYLYVAKVEVKPPYVDSEMDRIIN